MFKAFLKTRVVPFWASRIGRGSARGLLTNVRPGRMSSVPQWARKIPQAFSCPLLELFRSKHGFGPIEDVSLRKDLQISVRRGCPGTIDRDCPCSCEGQ